MFIFTINYITPVDAANNNANIFNAGPYKVRVEVNPETPKVGRNKVSIWLLDKAGDPLTGATLKAVAVMPSMGSMPAMYAPAEMAETDPGLYEGEFEPSMGGEWPLTVEINSTAGSGEITFDLATGRKGLRCSTCGGQNTTPGTIHVDPARRQLIGISTCLVEQKILTVTIRAAGKITYDESQLNDVTLKFNGWIGKLYANVIGKSVKKGQPLFTVYSPELLATQEEYLLILKRGKDKRLRQATHRRLRLWNLSAQQIKNLEKRGKAQEYVPILAPNDGIVIGKQIVAGSAFKAGQRLLRTADISHVWVEAQVYDYELPLIKTGMKANVVLPELQDRECPAEINFIYPFMESDTRTARVRVTLENADGFLRPDMYAQLHLKADLGKRLLVPESAVLYAGQSRVVFLDLGEGKLLPRKIKTGQRNRQWIEVLEGLNEGDKVVTSGNFLIAAESKLKAGIEQW
jgi:Cu(I)/Ag(I) efflux system membrane fusion protein